MAFPATSRHHPLIVLAVVAAVLLCMIFMPGMAIFALAGVAGAMLLLPRLIRQVVRPLVFVELGGHVATPVGQDRAGPGPPLPAPLRL